jgi:uncharacterized membrane protein YhaH (DUF805 family)
MMGDAADSPASPDQAGRAERSEDLVWWGTWIGVVLAAVGFIDGLVMALTRKTTTCADGKYFPEGTTDFNCYTYPQAGLGIAVAALSVVLGIVVVFASIAARASLGAQAKSTDG